ncbi:MAG TPA: hypothetical protein VNI84_16610 [Pyrinomonadaceae bacterium]|nr:hypothetical protein [Pyrinomonadaceae bacterium]
MSKQNFYPVSIAFACNDDYGNDEGKFSAAEIGDDLLSLENKYFPPKCPRLEIRFKPEIGGGFAAAKGRGYVKISKRKFSIVGYKSHWGNIMWDLVIVTPETAIEIINHLKKLDCFSCDGGGKNFFDKFNSDAPLEWTDTEKNLLRTNGYQRP